MAPTQNFYYQNNETFEKDILCIRFLSIEKSFLYLKNVEKFLDKKDIDDDALIVKVSGGYITGIVSPPYDDEILEIINPYAGKNDQHQKIKLLPPEQCDFEVIFYYLN